MSNVITRKELIARNKKFEEKLPVEESAIDKKVALEKASDEAVWSEEDPAIETADAVEKPEVIPEEDPPETVENPDDSSGNENDDTADKDKAPAEDWTKGDATADDATDDDDEVKDTGPSGLAKAVREKTKAKYQGRLEARDAEIEQLRRENEELKKAPPKIVTPAPATPRPVRKDFKTDEAYEDALYLHRREREQLETATVNSVEEQKRRNQETRQRIQTGLQAHYDEVAAVAKTMPNLKAEDWSAADRRVRKAIDEVFPGRGDTLADALFGAIGKGSAKVVYQLGVNSAKREELQRLLKEDPLGHKAVGHLNRMAEKMNAIPKRVSGAPSPTPKVQGDKGTPGVGMMKAKYLTAKKNGDTQEMFRISRQAKKQKVDTRAW